MKKTVKRKAGVQLLGILIVAAIIGLFLFIASQYSYVKQEISPNGHPMSGLLLACLDLWLISTIWLSIASFLVLIVSTPFLIWPSLRPAAIRACTIGVLALLCARSILFCAGLPVNPNRSMEPPRLAAHFRPRFQPHLCGRYHRPTVVPSSLGT